VYFPNKILGQMSKNRDLLKEAIEDAKVVKETAIASAKAALEEHFTPQLKSMLSAKLQEMEEMEEAEIDDNMEEMYSKKDENLMGYKEVKEEEDLINNPGGAGNLPKYQDMVAEEGLDELNLEELLAELEEDMAKETTYEAKEDDEMKKEELNEAEGEEEVETEEEINIEDMTEEELKSFIEDVIKDMVEAGELEAGEGMEDMKGEEGEEMESEEEEISIDEILAEIELDEAKRKKLIKSKDEDKKDKEDEEDKKEIKKLKNELEEAMSTISTMRSDINEVNLLNAKLLYTNKIFKAKNLTESQKVKVLNAFDKASTVKETKLVFETLSEGLKETSKSHVNESLKTSLASKTTGIMPTARKPIVEVNDTFIRMQKIAGIIK
jgi:hypothetical protein